jgi:hypothetical protein
MSVATGKPSDAPLNVAVHGDQVLIMGPDGEDIVLTVRAAHRSAQRLLDAVAVAEGRLPAERIAEA